MSARGLLVKTKFTTVFGDGFAPNDRAKNIAEPNTGPQEYNTLALNGSTQYADLGAALQFSAAQTWSIRVFLDATTPNSVIMGRLDVNYRSIAIRIVGERVYFTVYPNVGNNTGSAVMHHTQVLETGQWYHIICAYDGTNFIRVNVDNADEQTTPYSNTVGLSSDAFTLGADGHGGGFVGGSFTEARMWNRSLTPEEETALNNGGKFLPSSELEGLGLDVALVLDVPFNDGDPEPEKDKSPNGADATLIGGPTYTGEKIST